MKVDKIRNLSWLIVGFCLLFFTGCGDLFSDYEPPQAVPGQTTTATQQTAQTTRATTTQTTTQAATTQATTQTVIDESEQVSATILVPGDFDTIQGAIDAASDGDEIVVSPGRYVEQINYQGKNITVRSIDPSDRSVVESTIIDADGQGRVVTFDSFETNEAALLGFTITGGNEQEGGGLFIGGMPGMRVGASPLIAFNLIMQNTAQQFGGGLYLQNTAAVIVNNRIVENEAGSSGGGILVGFDARVEIIENVISHNVAGMFGGGIRTQASARIFGNQIVNNHAGMADGGISILAQEGEPVLQDNRIEDNTTGRD